MNRKININAFPPLFVINQVYNIYIGDKHICSRRYKEFSNLHNKVSETFLSRDKPMKKVTVVDSL